MAQIDKRLHFGIMFSTLDNSNQNEIWRGVADYANNNNIHITAYIGTYQGDDNSVTSFLETCFGTVANSKFLDGVILFSGFIAQNVGLEKFNEFVARLPEDLPKTSVHYPLPGVPSVLADGFGGIYDAVDHLIKAHGKKNIVIVKGPDGHPEAEDRLAGYKKALEDNGIPLRDEYMMPGSFIQEDGRRAVRVLFDERKMPVDAIVCCNDQMAFGALTELKAKQILVPTEVAVTGFDDDAVSSTFIPSLSTAKQDFFEIGRKSAEILHKILAGETAPEKNYVPPIFIKRQSCGCLEEEYSKKNALKHFTETVQRYDNLYADLPVWKEAREILNIERQLSGGELNDAKGTIAALLSATAFVHDIRVKRDKNRAAADENIRRLIRIVTNQLILTFNIEALIELLFTYLPGISMHTALIGIYRSPIRTTDPDGNREVVTLIGFDGERKFNISHNTWNPIVFSDFSTFEHFELERQRRAMFFIPLFFESDEVGAILLPYEFHIPLDSYERLRVSVSTAIRGAQLLSTIQTLSVTDELTGLYNRRGFFQFAYSRMQHLRRNTGMLPFVMFMDMDGLKAINDTYGHSEGDVAIAAFAGILTETLREEDIIGRMGGDEFTVFSVAKSAENVLSVVQRIREKMDEYNAQKRHPYLVSGSIGHVVLENLTKESFEAAMLSADSILYEEKMMKKKQGLSRA